MMMNRVQLINLPVYEDPRGNISIIEEVEHIPFEIERVYWIYDVPGGQKRGGHAFKEQHEVIVALSGSFDVVIDDGNSETSYSLNRSYKGLFIPCGYWRYMTNFSTNSVALVLSSTKYKSEDYIRNYDEFLEWGGRYKINSI